jgi:hypothetical protein
MHIRRHWQGHGGPRDRREHQACNGENRKNTTYGRSNFHRPMHITVGVIFLPTP